MSGIDVLDAVSAELRAADERIAGLKRARFDAYDAFSAAAWRLTELRHTSGTSLAQIALAWKERQRCRAAYEAANKAWCAAERAAMEPPYDEIYDVLGGES